MAGGSGGRGRGEDYDDKRGVAQVGTFEVLLVQCDGEASTNQDRFSRSPATKKCRTDSWVSHSLLGRAFFLSFVNRVGLLNFKLRVCGRLY